MGESARSSESPALALAKAVPNAKVVKTFNTAFAQIHAETAGKSEKPPQVLVGGDADTKATVKVLIEEAGFEPFDAGGLDLAPTDGASVGMAIRGAAAGSSATLRDR